MANIKSAKKRILVNRTKADRNKAIRSGVKTSIKKVFAAIDTKDKAAAQAALLEATADNKGKTIYVENPKSAYLVVGAEELTRIVIGNEVEELDKSKVDKEDGKGLSSGRCAVWICGLSEEYFIVLGTGL